MTAVINVNTAAEKITVSEKITTQITVKPVSRITPSFRDVYIGVGKDGADGYTPVKGVDYFDGEPGLSAYQIWLSDGNSGTEADFLLSLKGDDGQTFVTSTFVDNTDLTPPAAGQTKLVSVSEANKSLIATIDHYGEIERYQPHWAFNSISAIRPRGDSVYDAIGMRNLTFQGSQQNLGFATTNLVTRARRYGVASSVSTGHIAAFYSTAKTCTTGTGTGLGGFFWSIRFAITDTRTDAFFFAGISENVAAVGLENPLTQNNQAGFFCLPGDTNFKFFSAGSNRMASGIDLGTNFSISSDELYEAVLFSPSAQAKKLFYQLRRLSTGQVVSGEVLNPPLQNLIPDPSIALSALRIYRVHQTQTQQTGFALANFYMETN